MHVVQRAAGAEELPVCLLVGYIKRPFLVASFYPAPMLHGGEAFARAPHAPVSIAPTHFTRFLLRIGRRLHDPCRRFARCSLAPAAPPPAWSSSTSWTPWHQRGGHQGTPVGASSLCSSYDAGDSSRAADKGVFILSALRAQCLRVPHTTPSSIMPQAASWTGSCPSC